MRKTLRLPPVAIGASLAIIALSGLTGCSHAFREPVVRLASVVPNGIGLRGGSLTAQLEVRNPNRFGLRTDNVSYRFEILDSNKSDTSWVPVTSGSIDKNLEVGSGDRTIIEIPIEFRYEDFGPAMRSVIDRGSFKYRVTGSVDLLEPLKRTIPFKKTDTFSLAVLRW
jgi:LEA14-like dessication related protein